MNTRTIALTSRYNRTITLLIEGGVIKSIENLSGIYFPFTANRPYNQSIKAWAENNNFLFDGEDLEKKHRKVFGIRIKDVPQGHPLRFMYPNKFR